MPIEIDEPGPPLTPDDLELAQKELQVRFTDQYCSFLLKHNGGLPSPDTIDVEGAPGSPTDVQVFFGIGRAIESSDLRWNRQEFSGRLPERMLPIACDSGGNLFCISVAGNDEGSVIYVDLEPPEPTFYLAANSFDEFVERRIE